nr:uncharacterized protein LOC123763015 [Procambarus clarkii]XP_045605897.1 uncharacterized protein LOC123763015 [Procambarus clarkii]
MAFPRWRLVCVMVVVVGCATSMSSIASPTQDIRLDSVLLDWTNTLDETEATVCFQNGRENSRSNSSQYELVITNDLGRRWQQRGASMADNRWCFPGVILPRSDLSKTLRASVTLKDASLKTVLARKEIELFPIVPWVDGVVVSWRNPGGHTFTVRREGDPGPLATSLTCDSCSYIVLPQDEEESVVIIETQYSSPAHQLSRVAVGYDFLANAELQLLEIHQVLRDGQPLGTDHNLRLTILPLDDIPMVQGWKLILTDSNQSWPCLTPVNLITYTNNTAAEIEFECNLIDSIYIFLAAYDDTNFTNIIAFYYAIVSIEDLGTRVAWVGGDGDLRYLRVEAGTLDQVTVGDQQCSSAVSPCYFSTTEFHEIPHEIPRCKNLTTSTNETILQCDDIIGTSQKMDEVPQLVLLQEEKVLKATYSLNASSAEVVVTNWTDNSVFPSDSNFECLFVDTSTCKAAVTHGLEGKGVNTMLVLLNEKGYVTNSVIVPFEVYKVSARTLLQDVLQVTWDDASAGVYQVSISNSSAESHVTVNCSIDGGQADASCQAHLVQLALAGKSSVTVQKYAESNAVLTTVVKDELATTGEVRKVMLIDDDTPMTRVILASTKPDIHNVTLVRIVEDAEESNSFIEDYYEGSVKYINDDYVFEFSGDILQSVESVDFLVLGYLDDGTIGVVGAAYLTLNVLQEKIVWVGAETTNSSASVRVDPDSPDNVINGSKVCFEGASSCYYLEVGGEQAVNNVQRCEKVNNTAPGGPPQVYHCDTSATPFTELTSVTEVKVTGENLLVTLGASVTNGLVEVIAYDPSNPGKVYSDPANSTCNSEVQNRKCTQPLKGTQEKQVVNVLVVQVDNSGTVLGSTLLQASVPVESTKAWVIVVSVLGAVFGVAIIAAIIIIIVKKKKLAKSETRSKSSLEEVIHDTAYSTTNTPPPGLSQASSWNPSGRSTDYQNDEFASGSVYLPKVSLKPRGSPSGHSHSEYSPSTSNRDTRF